MLESLKQAGKDISRGLSRTWENISEGWRELVHHSSDALTHFSPRKDKEGQKDEERRSRGTFSTFPTWSLLAGEIEETDKEIVVRVEMPGMEKEDCHITIDGSVLYLRGEKRLERSREDGPTILRNAPMGYLNVRYHCRAMWTRTTRKRTIRTAC